MASPYCLASPLPPPYILGSLSCGWGGQRLLPRFLVWKHLMQVESNVSILLAISFALAIICGMYSDLLPFDWNVKLRDAKGSWADFWACLNPRPPPRVHTSSLEYGTAVWIQLVTNGSLFFSTPLMRWANGLHTYLKVYLHQLKLLECIVHFIYQKLECFY